MNGSMEKNRWANLYVKIVGLDMNAAKEAFSAYLNEANLDSRQIYFVNQIVNTLFITVC